MDKEKWLAKLQSNNIPPRYPELDQRIRQHIRDKGSIQLVEGALGDSVNLSAYIEDIIETPEGISTKFYGISYLYKGVIDSRIIDAVAQMKRIFMTTAELVFKNWWLIPIFLFKRKQVLEWIIRIYWADLEPKIRNKKFSSVSRELIRAGEGLIDKDLLYCLVSFLEYDNAYRLRFQDAINKDIRKAFDTAISREKHIKDKLIVIKRIALIILWIPKVRRLVEEFFSRLDINKIKLDEADWYFCLRRVGYDYKGWSFENRVKEAERIDLENKHIILGI